MTNTKRASLEKLLDFANDVRRAGGGNPLDALMPAVPCEPDACLIARNLNFNCSVKSAHNSSRWAMYVGSDHELAIKISSYLSIEPTFYTFSRLVDPSAKADWTKYPSCGYEYSKEFIYGVVLPDDIGEIAAEFDNSWNSLKYAIQDAIAETGDEDASVTVEVPRGVDVELVALVEHSIKETYANATVINKDGSIVL